MNVAPLTVKVKFPKLNTISRLMLTSAAPGVGTPGAAWFTLGCRLVSTKGFEDVEFVVGSAIGAPK